MEKVTRQSAIKSIATMPKLKERAKKRQRVLNAPAVEGTVAADEVAPEWSPLLAALDELGASSDLTSVTAQLPEPVATEINEQCCAIGGQLLSLVQQLLRHTSEGAVPKLHDLVPLTAPLTSAHEPVYKQVAAFSAHATRTCEATLADGGRSAANGNGLRSGAPSRQELDDQDASEVEAAGEKKSSATDKSGHRAFRNVYMDLLAAGAAEELDTLRREEPGMDDAALGTLVDALEFGAETFAPRQQRLLTASVAGDSCWWERRARGDGRATGAADSDADARHGESSARAPPLVERVCELRRTI